MLQPVRLKIVSFSSFYLLCFLSLTFSFCPLDAHRGGKVAWRGKFFLFFSGDIDAKEDKEGADERHPSETLVEEEQRGYRGKERIQIEVIGGREGAEVLQHQVPHHKADERSQYPQEEQITPNGRDQQPLQGEVPGLEEKDGQNGEQAVEKDFPRDENRAVAPLQLEDNQAIEGPKQ